MTTTEAKGEQTKQTSQKDNDQPEITEKNTHTHGHDHENCDHDHDHDHDHKDDSDSDDGVTDPNKKSSRAEKKFKKAMVKLGLKPLTGVNRVTVKKGKDFMVSIDDPEILKSENTYVVFGKVNMDDMMGGAGRQGLNDFQPPTSVEEKKEVHATSGETAPQAETSAEDLNEEGLNPENIKMVMEYTKCTKAAAIRALRETNDDSVNAIMKITG